MESAKCDEPLRIVNNELWTNGCESAAVRPLSVCSYRWHPSLIPLRTEPQSESRKGRFYRVYLVPPDGWYEGTGLFWLGLIGNYFFRIERGKIVELYSEDGLPKTRKRSSSSRYEARMRFRAEHGTEPSEDHDAALSASDPV